MKSKMVLQDRLVILVALRLKYEKDNTLEEQNKKELLSSINDQIKLLEWVLSDD